MRRNLFFCIAFIALVIFSCKKEYSVETSTDSSKGSLRSDVTSECLPKTIGGTYVAGKTLNDSNFIEVDIDVSVKGSFTISTDTVNGYSFQSTGVFNDTGLNKVKLSGSGLPAAAGNNLFVISFDSSFCLVQIAVLPSGSTGQSSFTLNGTGGNCVDYTVAGNYVKDVALSISNTVDISVNVTTPGAYTLTTAPVNGMTFSATGAFANSGVQNITLTGTGTPTAEGTFPVSITAGTATCTFDIIVTATAPVTSTDYFPLTANSWWSYDDPDQLFVSGTDTLTRVNINSIVANGNTYRIFQAREGTTPFDSSFFRKSGSDYLEYTFADQYTAAFQFDNIVPGEINFLKENLTTGQTWESAEFSGTTGGMSSKLKYVFTCTNANATVTVNGKSFSNVYQVEWRPQVSMSGTPYQNELVTFTSYYAKGIGLIYMKATVNATDYEMMIRSWNVL